MADNGVSGEVSREKLEKELQGIEDRIKDIEDRLQDVEDKDMMAQLETLSIEDEVQEVEEMLNHMDQEELEKRLNMIEQIKDEYQEGKVHEKLEYLYSQIKDLREQVDGKPAPGSNNAEGETVDSELRRKVENLEERIEDAKQTAEMPEKYKKAVRSNYNNLKTLKEKLEEIEEQVTGDVDHPVNQEDLEDLRARISELEGLKAQIKEVRDNGEVVFVERNAGEQEGTDSYAETRQESPEDISHIEFDLKSIKSRLSALENQGVSGKLDKTDLRDLRRRVKKLEGSGQDSGELQAFKNDIQQDLNRLERQAVNEEELNDEIEELRDSIDNRIRQLSSEIDRAVREGEERLQTLEGMVEEGVLEDIQETEEDLSERIDTVVEIILDNQDYIESLDDEINRIEANVENELENFEGRVKEEEEVRQRAQDLPSMTSTDELENLKKKVERLEREKDEELSLEDKIDNLAEHVMRNQEKIHEIQQKIEAGSSPREPENSSNDITIIS